MKPYNRKGNFVVDLTYDGCFVKCLTITIPTLSASRRTVRELIKIGYKLDDLAIRDLDMDRYISFVI